MIGSFHYEGVNFINFTDLSDDVHLKILSLRNDERIRKWMFNDKIIDIGEHKLFVEKLRGDNTKLYFVACDKESLVGCINLVDIDFKNMRCKLGIYSNPDLKGYGGKLIKTLKWLTFDKLGLNCLRLEVLANNTDAIKFYEKHLFLYEGCYRSYISRHDQFIDVLVYSMLRSEYVSKK